jgi:CheY-like chemotaxis protein
MTAQEQAGQPAGHWLRRLLAGLTAVRCGDFSTRLPAADDPVMDEIAAVFNAMSEELQRSKAELKDRAALLACLNRDIEVKNVEIEQARHQLEERARELDLASRYKSQFLTNMSHELRTPLNSLLILARLLAQNPEQNLTPKQVEYAQVIHSSGADLLHLINDALDLSRVEAGRTDLHPERFAHPGGAPEPLTMLARPPEAAAGGHESLRGRTVLIVDDDLRNAFAISSILELYGMTVMHAPDGRTGLEMLCDRDDIGVVLTDVMMPELDGYATIRAIREIPDLDGLPVIAVTARAMPGDREKSIAAGASDYVTKPVDTEELLGCMERSIGSRPSPG